MRNLPTGGAAKTFSELLHLFCHHLCNLVGFYSLCMFSIVCIFALFVLNSFICLLMLIKDRLSRSVFTFFQYTICVYKVSKSYYAKLHHRVLTDV